MTIEFISAPLHKMSNKYITRIKVQPPVLVADITDKTAETKEATKTLWVALYSTTSEDGKNIEEGTGKDYLRQEVAFQRVKEGGNIFHNCTPVIFKTCSSRVVYMVRNISLWDASVGGNKVMGPSKIENELYVCANDDFGFRAGDLKIEISNE